MPLLSGSLKKSTWITENGLNQLVNQKSGKTAEFLRILLLFLRKNFKQDVSSIILFGSYATKQNKQISDLDLLIVMKDSVDRETLHKISRNLRWLEQAVGLVKPPKGSERVLRAIEVKTGMFVCHFLCRRRDFINWRFARVFSLSRFFAKLLAPGDLVRMGFQASAITIVGEDLLSKIPHQKPRPTQLLKSCSMNLLHAMGSLLIGILSSRATIYSMEAVKWSLFSSYTYITGKGAPFNEQIAFFRRVIRKNSLLSSQLGQLMQLREEYRPSPRFSMKAPLIIFLIHKMAIQERKSGK
ncbi:MAG: nucleotidyltransferase domain-containing protein [Candidatus Heimdallarchaeota archaeon]